MVPYGHYFFCVFLFMMLFTLYLNQGTKRLIFMELCFFNLPLKRILLEIFFFLKWRHTNISLIKKNYGQLMNGDIKRAIMLIRGLERLLMIGMQKKVTILACLWKICQSKRISKDLCRCCPYLILKWIKKVVVCMHSNHFSLWCMHAIGWLILAICNLKSIETSKF